MTSPLIRPSGVIASSWSARQPEPVFPYYPLASKGVTLRLVQAYIRPPTARAKSLSDIREALSDGMLAHRIARIVPLEERAAAHELIESGEAMGKVVVEVV